MTIVFYYPNPRTSIYNMSLDDCVFLKSSHQLDDSNMEQSNPAQWVRIFVFKINNSCAVQAYPRLLFYLVNI